MKPNKFMLPAIAALTLFFTTPAKAKGIPVFDAANIGQWLIDYFEQMIQSEIQGKISDYSSDILDVDKVIQQATGTVSGRQNYTKNMQSTLNQIPNRMKGTFGGLLGFDGEKRWGNNNPIGGTMTTLIDNMMGRGQKGARQVNAGLESGYFDANKAAGSFSQMVASQTLLNEGDKVKTLQALSEQANLAEDQQQGQAIQTQSMLEGVAAQNEANTIMASDSLSRQEAMSEKRRNTRNRAAGAAAANMETYLGTQ